VPVTNYSCDSLTGTVNGNLISNNTIPVINGVVPNYEFTCKGSPAGGGYWLYFPLIQNPEFTTETFGISCSDGSNSYCQWWDTIGYARFTKQNVEDKYATYTETPFPYADW